MGKDRRGQARRASWEQVSRRSPEARVPVCVGHRPGSSLPLPQELVTFAKYILGKFFALAAVNQKAFVELLFWKNTAVVREMTEGYGSQDGG